MNALGWTLLHSLWQGALIAAIVGGIVAATRSPRVRYAAACFAMLVLLVSFAATFVRFLPEDSAVPLILMSRYVSLPHQGFDDVST